MTEHSPTPWFIDLDTGDVFGADGKVVVDGTYSYPFRSVVEIKANLHAIAHRVNNHDPLLAAAKDMARGVEAALKMIDMTGDKGRPEDRAWIEGRLAVARTAIATAEMGLVIERGTMQGARVIVPDAEDE